MSNHRENNQLTTQTETKLALGTSENAQMPMPVNSKNDNGISLENKEKLEKLALDCENAINKSNHTIADIGIQIKEMAKQEKKKIEEVIALISFDGKLKKMSPQHLNKFIRNKDFFNESRPMNGISATAGFLISAPQNEDIAVKLYEQVANKNLSVDAVKALIAQMRNKKIKIKPSMKKVAVIDNKAREIIDFVDSLFSDTQEALQALTTCCAHLNELIKDQTAIEGASA
jgi:hypothetical protein